MSFINPYILFGLVATAIPIILHILFRRRYKKVRWAAMQFLLRAYQQTRRSFILENLLLLILRILIVFFLILLFARPVARATRFLQITQTVDNYIVCMDTSYSMSLQSSNITPLENAKKHAHGILEKASIHDTFTLMTFNETTEAFIKFSSITNDKQKQNFAQKIDEIQITDMGTEPFCFVDTLLEWNQEFGYDNQHIYILSDFQKNAWEEVAKNSVFQNKLKQLKEKTLSMTLMDCQVSNPQNIGITKLESSGLLALQGNGRFIATIQNYGDKIYNEFSVNMYINGQKQGTEYVSLLPYKETEVVFSPSFTHAGQHSITIEIPADGLNHDNKRHLSFQVLDKINLLVVDGDPSDSVHRKFEGETDFFMAAVGTLSDSIIKPKKINIGNFTPDISFSDYDVVLLANVQNFATEQRYAELETFVQKGGGLNIWLGDKILPDLYHQYLYKIAHEILPAQIQNQTMGSEKEGQKTTFNITNVIDHPIWRYFHDNKKLMEDLKNVFVYRFYPTKVDTQDMNTTVLATLNTPSKHPIFLERKYGKGKIILSTTTLDNAWNNLHTDQYGHVFVILSHEIIYYLGMIHSMDNNLKVRTPIVKIYDHYIQEAKIKPPDKDITNPYVETLQKGTIYKLTYNDTTTAGIYTLNLTIPPQILEEKNKIQTQEYIAINVDATEGNISSIPKTQLLHYFQNLGVQFQQTTEESTVSPQIKSTEYWKFILMILLFLALAETFLSVMNTRAGA